MKGTFAAFGVSALGTGLLALAEATGAQGAVNSVSMDVVEKVLGAVLVLGGSIEGARRWAAQAKAEAREAKRDAEAADQRATAVGRKLDELRKEVHDANEKRAHYEGIQEGRHEVERALWERLLQDRKP